MATKRLTELDLPDRFSGVLPVPVTQVLVGLAGAALAFGTRALVDMILPAAGPFALTFPFVLLATLVARWPAGLLAQIFCALFAWYFVLPVQGSFDFAVASDRPRVVVNVLSGLGIIALAEAFRRAVREAVAAREDEVEQRDLYLREFEHRVQNNFAIISSILDMQRRQLGEGAASDAIAEARARVESIARAHRYLYHGGGGPRRVAMEDYLPELCESLRSGLLAERPIRIDCVAQPVALDRDRAVSIGLLANELVTNAAKHAFPDGEDGHIALRFDADATTMRLTVEDDGVGMQESAPSPKGLGQRLMAGFAAQAGGVLERIDLPRGTRFVVTMARTDGD